jgi:hypothetical protein
MTNQEIYTKSLNTQHAKIMNRLAGKHPTSKLVLVSQKYTKLTLSIIFIGMGSAVSVWFVNNLMNNRVLLQPSLVDISGVEWVWSPELLGLAILLYFIGVSLQKSLSENTFRLAGLGAMAVFAVFINIAFLTPTTLAFQTNIQPDFNKLGYRVLSRDNHIKILLEKDTYYGVVTGYDEQNNLVQVDHGGVIKSFVSKPSKVNNLINKTVKIQFEKQGEIFILRSIVLLT